jgi:hypothetical protein
MAIRRNRSNIWSGVFLVLLFAGGFCVMGFWQSYDIQCTYGKQWTFTTFPPQYLCRAM